MLEVDEGHLCPSCGSMAVPEQDGDVLYQVCDCGFEFGYHRVTAPEPSCQLGIPEEIRRQNARMLSSIEAGATAVFMGSTIRRRT